jgi:hypothetical protein
MIAPGSNPLALWRCLPGRAYSTCVHAPADAPAAPNCTADYLSEPRFFRPPTTSSPPFHPLASTKALTHNFLEPHLTALQTEQNPLKIDLPSKV